MQKHKVEALENTKNYLKKKHYCVLIVENSTISIEKCTKWLRLSDVCESIDGAVKSFLENINTKRKSDILESFKRRDSLFFIGEIDEEVYRQILIGAEIIIASIDNGVMVSDFGPAYL